MNRPDTMGRDLAQWPARNDMVVLAVLMGRSMASVGEEYGVSESTVGNIVNHPRAKEIIAAARQRIREKVLENIEDQLDLAAKASLKVIKRTLKADISPVHKAKANQDRVALKVLQGRGFLSEEGSKGGGGMSMTPEQFGTLMSALQKSDEARGIDPFEIQEAEFEVEDSPESVATG